MNAMHETNRLLITHSWGTYLKYDEFIFIERVTTVVIYIQAIVRLAVPFQAPRLSLANSLFAINLTLIVYSHHSST